MIQIGDKSFNTRRPADLDAALLPVTGCSAVEVQRQLQSDPLAQHVARALKPFLVGDGVPDVAALTDLIAAAGSQAIGGQVATLYAAVPSVAAAAAEGDAPGDGANAGG